MAILNDDELTARLTEIEDALVEGVPAAVQRLNVREPAYCLFLCYFDLSTAIPEDFTPQVVVGLERIRRTVIRDKGDDAWQYLWSPQELDNIERLPSATCEGDRLRANCAACFQHFSDVLGDDTPGDEDDEGELLLPFRSAVQQAALRLNKLDWSRLLDVTDDFVVAPTDSIGYWTPLDIEAGIPPERLELLRERKLLWQPGDLDLEDDDD